jgi:hypothetical protein
MSSPSAIRAASASSIAPTARRSASTSSSPKVVAGRRARCLGSACLARRLDDRLSAARRLLKRRQSLQRCRNPTRGFPGPLSPTGQMQLPASAAAGLSAAAPGRGGPRTAQCSLSGWIRPAGIQPRMTGPSGALRVNAETALVVAAQARTPQPYEESGNDYIRVINFAAAAKQS